MSDVILFHHAQGLTDGVRAFADALREAGHRVSVPDLYDGATFATLEAGIANAQALGIGTILERGGAAAAGLPGEVVYAGLSLGVLPAQMLAETRAGARGALLIGSCVPAAEFGAWPDGLPVQIHAMDADPIFTTEGDVDAARELAATAERAELFLYPGDAHLFFDRSVPAYDEAAAALLRERVLAFLDAV